MSNIDKQAELLEDYIDWRAAQDYRERTPEAFLQERETGRLARNAEAVLLFLEDWRQENIRDEDRLDAGALSSVVGYLLNAEVGDPEVEEWFEPETEEVTVTTQTLTGDVINEVTSKVKVQSYNSEEGYYEDEEPR